MALKDCIEAIRQASGDKLDDDEVLDLLDEIKTRAERIRRERNVPTEEAYMQAADAVGRDAEQAAIIERRNAALNAQRRVEAVDYVRSNFPDKPVEGIEAMLVGVNRARQGARASVNAEQRALQGHYVGGLVQELRRLGRSTFAMLTSGVADLDIARALFSIDNHDAPAFRLTKEVRDIAAVIHKWQERARYDANRAGAFIGKLPGWIVRQSHDLYKIRRAGFQQWRDAILPLLDMQRTVGLAPGENYDAYLRSIYDGLASGVHLGGGEASERLGQLKGPANLARKMSQERELHFKGADEWFAYNRLFGTGNVREAILQGLSRSAQSTALLRTLGTNPQAMLQDVFRAVEQSLRGDVDGLRKFREQQPKLENRLMELDGRASTPVNAQAARIAGNVRAWESLSKLGGALISSLADIPTYAAEMRYQGRNVLGAMGEAISGLLKGRGTDEQREILSQLGMYFEHMVGEIGSRFTARDDLGGRMSRLQSLFFKLNGLEFWTDAHKATAALSMSHHLGLSKGKAWDGLSAELRRALSLYGIDSGKWDILRSGAAKMADGREYVTPEHLATMPDQAFADYLAARDIKPTSSRVRDLREEIASQYRQYIVDRTSYAVIEPDARTRAVMRQGTRPGTVPGEILRFIGQFKAFPVAFLQKAVGRELYGRGTDADTMIRALRSGNGEFLGMAQLFLLTTMFGYGSMVVKDLLKGRTPRAPDDRKTWLAAAAQGGGLGIYGDFLFGQNNRMGGGLIGSLAGPTAGVVEDVHDIYGRIRDGDDAAAKILSTTVNNTPFLNLFYTRLALDYAILYRAQEMLNPGYLRRMERRVEKENHQTFAVRPSEVIR